MEGNTTLLSEMIAIADMNVYCFVIATLVDGIVPFGGVNLVFCLFSLAF